MADKIRGVVTAPGLNLRPQPHADSPWIDQLEQGDELEVTAVVGTKDWIHVKVVRTGKSGWVAARFVEVTPPPVDVPKPEPKPKAPCAPGRGAEQRAATKPITYWVLVGSALIAALVVLALGSVR